VTARPPAGPVPGRWNYGFRTAVYGGVVVLLGWGAWRVQSAMARHEREMSDARQTIDTLHSEVAARDARISELDAQVAELRAEVQRLQAALRLLKVDHRLARLTVLDQRAAADRPGGVQTEVAFQELAADDMPLGPERRFTLDGKVAYVDALVIKFDDRFVEEGDALRGTSLCLFRRLFGEYQFPSEGFPLDTTGQRPLPYASDDADPGFESRLWSRFWDYAHDPDAVAAAGVRALHGEAPYMELRPGRSYRVDLRASGGLTVRVEE
jgi:uncharacterized coiled-coil protein SlyX